MTDKDFYAEEHPQARLRNWALAQMLRGAFIAGAVLISIGVILMAIWVVGQFLPPESKQAPSPYSMAPAPQQARVT